MDGPEEKDPSKWRPVSGLSDQTMQGSLSSLTQDSSSQILKDAAPAANGDQGAAVMSSQTGNPTSHRDLSPWETSACRRLTEQIRASSAKGDADTSTAGLPTRTIGPLLTDAGLTIQYNAKWFPETQLVDLINTALNAVASSNSSSELLAMVKLIDTTSTYAFLPQLCLHNVIRFLAQTYHGATRANKTKKLATAAWETLEKLLASHLGNQCIALLLQILEAADASLLEKQQGYAQVSGALHLMMELFQTKDAELPSATVLNIVTGLRALSSQSSTTLCENIMEATSQILEVDDAVETLDEVLGWDLVMEIAESCMNQSPDCDEAKKLFDIVIRHMDHFEERHLQAVALLAAKMNCEIPPQLAREVSSIADIVDNLDKPTVAKRLDEKLKVLSASMLNLDYFESFVKLELPALLDIVGAGFVPQLVVILENIASGPETPPGAIEIIADFCANLLEQSIGRQPETLSAMFKLLCTLSMQSTYAAEILLRTRADTEQGVYLSGAQNDRTFAKVQDFAPLRLLDKTIFSVITEPGNWKIYDCVTQQLAALLSNHSLFETRVHVVKELRNVICEQLKTGNYPEPPEETGRTKSILARNLVQILTAIVTYHDHLTRQELVAMISIFVDVSGIRDYGVSIDCIHALSVCCYEVPVTMSSYMDDVIDKMAKLVTQKVLAIHVLLFLAGLSRLPGLFRNFKEHDFKKIFGVCGNYLQSIRGTNALGRRQTVGSDHRDASAGDALDEMPQYVYALAHHVICFWYIAIRASERKALKGYITSCLRYHTDDGREKIEDQGLVTIDLMDAIDTREEGDDEDEEVELIDSEEPVDVLHKIVGSILISTYTSPGNKMSTIEIRRPSGKWKSLAMPNSSVELIDDLTLADKSTKKLLSPSSTLELPEVLTLNHSPELDRAIKSLDRVAGLDSHKAGIIYVGEGQKDEFEILQNSSGSPDYWEFVHLMGEPRRLRDATFNTQGLDRGNDMDGTSTIVWENDVTQLVFHITTLMPKDPESVVNKKKHIGNDAVNIIFNNAGRPFQFDTLPTQVTHVYIVVSPSDRTSFLQARRPSPESTSAKPSSLSERFYRVHVIARPGYPTVSPAADEKVVSGDSLPAFVRNLALNECILALMWDHRHEAPGEFPSSWRYRLEQLRSIRERYASSDNNAAG